MAEKQQHNYVVAYDDEPALTLEAWKAMRDKADDVTVYSKRAAGDRPRGNPGE